MIRWSRSPSRSRPAPVQLGGPARSGPIVPGAGHLDVSPLQGRASRTKAHSSPKATKRGVDD
jgi:hypothetical protein